MSEQASQRSESVPDIPRSETEQTEAQQTGRFPLQLMHAAAVLYYLREETQADVARALGVSRATVSRLLAEARRLGIVRIDVVDLSHSPDPTLGPDLAAALGLSAVYVAPSAHGTVLRTSLAIEVGRALSAVGLERDDILLVSSGRTVWEVGREPLPRLPGIIVTPMVGGAHEPEAWYQTNEITRMYAESLGGHPKFLWAPALPGPGLHERLLQDSGTKEVLELWNNAKCALLGVGAPPQSRESMPEFVPRDASWLRSSAGDIVTRFYDSEGHQLSYPGSERLIATTYDMLRQIPHTIAVGVGEVKVPSLLAGARAHWFNTLVTDAPTAAALLARAQVAH